MAFVPPAIPASGTGRSFRIAAIELIGARRCGFSDATATVASDVYAFAILACEVRVKLTAPLDTSLNGIGFVDRSSLGNLHSPTRVLSQAPIRC